MTTTRAVAACSAEARLAATGRQLDGLRLKARHVPAGAKGRTRARVESMQGHLARARKRLGEIQDEAQQDWDDYLNEMDRDLDRLDWELELSEAELEADLAQDAEAFAEAVAAEQEHWDRYLSAVQATSEGKLQAGRDRVVAAFNSHRSALNAQLARLKKAGYAADARARRDAEAAHEAWRRTADALRDELD